jgi:hypothetical protein
VRADFKEKAPEEGTIRNLAEFVAEVPRAATLHEHAKRGGLYFLELRRVAAEYFV